MNIKETFCHICGLNVKIDLSIHLIRKHKKDEVKCTHCGKEFGNSTHLKDHARQVHGEKKNCSVCFKSFLKSYKENAHSNNHYPIFPEDEKI